LGFVDFGFGMFQAEEDAVQYAIDVGIDGGDLFVVGKAGNGSCSVAADTFEFQ
jgi:hypothetical protein